MKNTKIILLVAVIVGAVGFLAMKPKEAPMAEITPTVTESEKCLIKVAGNEYDITPFRGLHPGGDIFKCGTDMSEVFKKQHDDDLERIKKFLTNEN